MKHLIICPEYPPAPIAAGGIGTYAKNIAQLLARSGEIVHVITVMWPGAAKPREELCNGRLIIHRVSVDQILDIECNRGRELIANDELISLSRSDYPEHCFAWQAALLAESLVESENIDLIEAQEFQAPLYYFQLRRALGLGPKKKPPCVVHLHSPTELIYRFNDWSSRQAYAQIARQMEAFSIKSADHRLCPSRYMAGQVEQLYGLDPGSTTVIPLPVGDTPILERNIDVWRDGTVCYVGRLEPRKGVVEWIDAAVAVADDYPSATFEFIGADLPYVPGQTVRQYLNSRIPHRLKSRFLFPGEVSRSELMRSLARARIAAVPSRWENFPNTCVEAMGTGLPVIASRNGGMIEMIEDEISGWVAPVQQARGLEIALRRALDTRSLDLATMGRRAARAIRELCKNDMIVERHLKFRENASKTHSSHNSYVPDLSSSDVAVEQQCGGSTEEQFEVVAVVGVLDNLRFLDECLQQINTQGIARENVIVVFDEKLIRETDFSTNAAKFDGYRILKRNSHNLAELWNAGATTALSDNARPDAVIFLTEQDKLLADCVGKFTDVLRRRADVGIVSGWTSDGGRLIPHLSPAFPYQLVKNSIYCPVMIRTGVFDTIDPFDTELGDGFALWNLVNESMAKDWVAYVYPQLLSEHFFGKAATIQADRSRMFSDMLGKVDNVVAAHAVQIVELMESHPSSPAIPAKIADEESQRPRILRPSDVLRLPLQDQITAARTALRNPGRASRFLLWHTKVAITRLTGRIG